MNDSEAAARSSELGVSKAWLEKNSMSQICSDDPRTQCDSNDQARSLPPSEGHNDFFFLSELRFYVLHAFALINWVWY